jgi:plastocyanin
MNEFPDTLPEEREQGNREVISFLQHVTKRASTDTTPEHTQALQRIEARLFSDRSSMISSSAPAHSQRTTFPKRSKFMHSSHTHRAAKPLSGLTALVEVLCIVVIVGSFFVVEQFKLHSRISTTGGVGNTVATDATVHLGPHSFSQASVIIPKGGSVRLVDDDNVQHLLYNGYWAFNNQEPQLVYTTEPGMPTIKNHILYQPHQELLLRPFTQVGLYHLFDTIHGDMTLTIVVTNDKEEGISTTSSLLDMNFSPSTVTVKKGTYLRLVNESSPQHVVYNGYWTNSGRIVPLKEHGLPAITNNHFTIEQSQHQEMWLGPFTAAGTFHLYDALHGGMNLIIEVK